VQSIDILDGTVTSADIADGTLTSADLAANAFTSANIGDGSVTGADIADGTLTSADLAANAFTGANIGDGSVTGADIADGSVTAVDLSPGVFDAYAAGGSGSTAIPGSIVIPAAAFRPEKETMVYDLSPGYIQPGAVSTGICVQAPVSLPNGVTVTQLEGIFWDNSNTQTVGVSLNRVWILGSGYYGGPTHTGAYNAVCYEITPDYTYCEDSPSYVSNPGDVVEMATASTSALGPLDQVVAATGATITAGTEVVTDSFAYFLRACFASDAISADNTRLYAARIQYN